MGVISIKLTKKLLIVFIWFNSEIINKIKKNNVVIVVVIVATYINFKLNSIDTLETIFRLFTNAIANKLDSSIKI
jgi:hypothetical protein